MSSERHPLYADALRDCRAAIKVNPHPRFVFDHVSVRALLGDGAQADLHALMLEAVQGLIQCAQEHKKAVGGLIKQYDGLMVQAAQRLKQQLRLCLEAQGQLARIYDRGEEEVANYLGLLLERGEVAHG